MGDEGEFWRDVRAARRERRLKYGVECPECKKHRPRTNPSILLPGQRCKVDGYRDSRPYLSESEKGE